MCELNSPLSILHTAAHPADAFDMAGGTLAHHVRDGDKVTVVVFTHGARSHAHNVIEGHKHGTRGGSVDEAADLKQREVVEACGVLGITDVRFLRYEDHVLAFNPDLVLALARIVREVRPDVVITHSPFENAGLTGAHRVCCDITYQACSASAGMLDGQGKPHRVGELFYVWQHGETTLGDYAVPRFPAILIDVTDVIDLKVKAIKCIRSQYYDGFAEKLYEACNGTHGLHMCVPYCEAFMRHYPEVRRRLPVCGHNLRIAQQPMEATYAPLATVLTPSQQEHEA
jgi:4-oxalomesaconate hydratase